MEEFTVRYKAEQRGQPGTSILHSSAEGDGAFARECQVSSPVCASAGAMRTLCSTLRISFRRLIHTGVTNIASQPYNTFLSLIHI